MSVATMTLRESLPCVDKKIPHSIGVPIQRRSLPIMLFSFVFLSSLSFVPTTDPVLFLSVRTLLVRFDNMAPPLRLPLVRWPRPLRSLSWMKRMSSMHLIFHGATLGTFHPLIMLPYAVVSKFTVRYVPRAIPWN